MHIFFSVGEPSGDEHGAHLIDELRTRQPDVRISGFGGPDMEQSGLESLFRLTNLAVMGILRVLPLLWKFYSLVKRAERFFAEQKPDAVVLIDFPGFNWWIARKAKAAGIPVFYYLPPQMWAWGQWRITKVRRFVDHVISALPFERDWYEARGVAVEYVGHPFFDEIADKPLDRRFIESWSQRKSPLVAVLPGSRNQEVSRNWPVMLEVLRRLHTRHPELTFLVACYSDAHRRECVQEMLIKAPSLPIQFFVGRTSEIIELGDFSLMVSGSVSLEMVARRTPSVVLYRIGRGLDILRRIGFQIRYISLPNLIANREVMPEFLSVGNPEPAIRAITDVLDRWTRLPEERQLAVAQLESLADGLVETGATRRTADFIVRTLAGETAQETRRAA
jgi:lipid-A-disaccharide synthase